MLELNKIIQLCEDGNKRDLANFVNEKRSMYIELFYREMYKNGHTVTLPIDIASAVIWYNIRNRNSNKLLKMLSIDSHAIDAAIKLIPHGSMFRR